MKTEENITAAADVDVVAEAAPYPDDHPLSQKNLGYSVAPPEHWRNIPPPDERPLIYEWTYTRGFVRV